MSDLSRLLDDVYQNGPVPPATRRPAPEPAAPEASVPAAVAAEPVTAAALPLAPAPPAPADDLSWASEESIEEAFADWVPGPGAGAPAAERELFELADDEPAAAPSVLDHVFTAEEDPLEQPAAAGALGAADVFDAAGLFDAAVAGEPTEPVSSLADLFDDPAPAPAPAAEHHEPPGPVVAAVEAAPAPAPAATLAAAPLAYEPPATLAEALVDAPEAPPADLAHDVEPEWPLAGLEPSAAPATVATGAGVLATGWRREHDDLLPTRGRRKR
jgi:hypothetical protein